jgi:hypothetical protein
MQAIFESTNPVQVRFISNSGFESLRFEKHVKLLKDQGEVIYSTHQLASSDDANCNAWLVIPRIGRDVIHVVDFLDGESFQNSIEGTGFTGVNEWHVLPQWTLTDKVREDLPPDYAMWPVSTGGRGYWWECKRQTTRKVKTRAQAIVDAWQHYRESLHCNDSHCHSS